MTPHFDSTEFDRPARPGKGFSKPAPYPEKWIASRLRPLCIQLEILRVALGRAIKVVSGFRDEAYNRAIKGARFSQHVQGRAADIVVRGHDADGVHEAILELYDDGQLKIGGLGAYPGFTHIDIRPSSRLIRWTGSRTAKETS